MTNQKHNPSKHNPSPKVKSTPGPWVISSRDFGPNGRAYDIDSESGAIVASDLALGDARLIAAAPELLDACYKSLADFEDLLLLHGGILDQELALNIHGAINALTQAIAKAEEETGRRLFLALDTAGYSKEVFATAPDMLELLKSLWELRGQINHDSIIWKEVKQVITKAEGE